MAYGAPEDPASLEAYYTDIRRGRPPSPDQLADLRRRYEAIGGLSPLAARTRAQVAGLQAELDRRSGGTAGRSPGAPPGTAGASGGSHWHVALGLKHAAPRIEDGVDALVAAGARRAAAIVLAPHHSALSVGEYLARAGAAAEGRLELVPVTAWGTHPALVSLLAARVRAARAAFPPAMRVELLVTAHSLPQRALTVDTPTYPAQLEATGAAVAALAGIDRWRVAWQSAGRTPEPWIGPDILDVLRRLPDEDVAGVVVCPAGFTSDHLEVLYDIDIEARRVAEEAGLRLERTASLNDDPAFMALLADLAEAAVGQ